MRLTKVVRYRMRRTAGLVLALLVLAQMAMPLPVYAAAATETLRPDSPGDECSLGSQLGCSACPNHWDCVDEAVADDDGSYVRSTGSINKWFRDLYHLDDSAIGAGEITSITVYARARASTPIGTALEINIKTGGVVAAGSQEGLLASYVTFSESWATSPATGLAWTWAEIDALQAGVNLRQAGTYAWSRCTQVYVNVNYIIGLPVVSTGSVVNIYDGTTCNSTLTGSVTDDGALDIDARGFAWGTTCNSTTPGNEPPSGSYTDNWTEYAADWGVGGFSSPSVNLTCCTTYCYRAYAHNTLGWAWGSEVMFSTMCDPDIDTQAATYIEATTVRLNALLVNDGGQPCDVRFCYGTTSGNCTNDVACATALSCNCTFYDTTTAWVENAYTSGQTPYVDITGLAINTLYYFCAQARNDYACECGGELSFTTPTGVGTPSALEGISEPTTVSLAWVKGVGSTNTQIYRRLGAFPIAWDGSDGSTLVYFDTLNSVLDTGLVPGFTYYYIARGESGGLYSTSNTTLMITTLAMGEGPDDLPVPGTPAQWFSAPDHTTMSAMPFYEIVNFAADAFHMPYATIWYMIALVSCGTLGVIFYSGIGNHNLVLTAFIVGIAVMVCAFMRLLPMWHIVPFGVIVAVGIFVGERR